MRGFQIRHTDSGFTLIRISGDCHHRRSGCLAAPGCAAGQGSRARDAKCKEQLQTASGLALHNYHILKLIFARGDQSGGFSLFASLPWTNTCATDCRSSPFTLLMLPFLEQTNLFNLINFSLPITSAQRSGTGPSTNQGALFTSPLPVFRCPSDTLYSDQKK